MYEVIYRKGDRRFVYKHTRTLLNAKTSARKLSNALGKTVLVRSESTDRIWAFSPEKKTAKRRTTKKKTTRRK